MESRRLSPIHSIDTRRREFFYWATVMTTFALGTALGDMTAITFNLGYLSSGILFAVLIGAVTSAHYAGSGSWLWNIGINHGMQSWHSGLPTS